MNEEQKKWDVVPFDTFEQYLGPRYENVPGVEYILENGTLLYFMEEAPGVYESADHTVTGATDKPKLYVPVYDGDELQPSSFAEVGAREQFAAITDFTVTMGLPGVNQRQEPGFVLDNGLVLLESERDSQGNYKAGAGMDGMFLQTGRVFAPSRYDGGEVTAVGEQPPAREREQEQAEAAPALPVVTEQQTLSVSAASVKTGKTTPPKHFTEDTLLAAMENAGKEDMPDDAERKGIGTPATRSGIIEKLVSSGFVERRKSKKITNLLPTSTGTALITVLPEQLQSPQLTAEWEHRLKEIERGEIAPDSFMDGIAAMLNELVQTYKPIPGTEVLFPSGREVVGKCPRCGAEVTESPKGFFCENRACSFVLWKNSRFFTAKKKVLTKSLAAALLKNGRAPLKGCYSEKTGKTYDASVLLEDDGQRTGYKLVFDNG